MNNPNDVGARHPRPKSTRKTQNPSDAPMTYGRSLTIEGAANHFVGFWARMARPYGSRNHNIVLFNPCS